MSEKVKLAVLSGRPVIQEYAQGTARDATSMLADFIAPTVEVSTHTGKYKSYDDETRFKIPETLRGLGGSATRLAFDRTDKEYNCQPHALDTPLDDIEVEESVGEDLLKEAADDSAFLGALAHEKRVIDLAIASAGAATGGNWVSDSVDPVKEINKTIIEVIKSTNAGGLVGVGVVFDPISLLTFFSNAKTKAYFPGSTLIAPTVDNLMRLFLGNTQARVSFMVSDTAPKGKASTKDFLVADKVLVFARNENPTRRDPSFMKTFRKRNRWMVPGIYRREDDRGDVVKMDWSSDVQATNTAAGKLFTVTNA